MKQRRKYNGKCVAKRRQEKFRKVDSAERNVRGFCEISVFNGGDDGDEVLVG
jgi:heme-degrading monooxygenase HmoA